MTLFPRPLPRRLHAGVATRLALATCVALLPAAPAAAHTFYRAELVCPIGGEHFSQTLDGSGTSFGMMLDFMPYGPTPAPWTLPECPGNGFVMYKREFTAAEIERLTPYVSGTPYQAMRAETSYYRAAQLMRHMESPPATIAGLLLQATWQADGERYGRYAAQALAAITAAMPPEPAGMPAAPPAGEQPSAADKQWRQWVNYQLMSGELERRTRHFDAARLRFEHLRAAPAAQAAGTVVMVRLQLRLISDGDNAPHRVDEGRDEKVGK
jgi:hypothetical protein